MIREPKPTAPVPVDFTSRPTATVSICVASLSRPIAIWEFWSPRPPPVFVPLLVESAKLFLPIAMPPPVLAVLLAPIVIVSAALDVFSSPIDIARSALDLLFLPTATAPATCVPSIVLPVPTAVE